MDRDSSEENPLLALSASDALFDDSQGEAGITRKRSSCPRRNWGIPTFQDQVDRNICHFTLYRQCYRPETRIGDKGNTHNKNDEESLTFHLEHRANSTGSDLWDAALVMCHSINRPGVLQDMRPLPVSWQNGGVNNMEWEKATVLELGSGTGAVGLYIGKFLKARHVILSDLAENLPLIQRNIEENNLEQCTQAVPLDWTKLDQLPDGVLHDGQDRTGGMTIDVIVGSDLFLPYASFLLVPLARLLNKLLQLHPHAVALICYEERFDPSAFFTEADDLHLSITRVSNEYLDPFYQDPGRIHMLRIQKPRST